MKTIVSALVIVMFAWACQNNTKNTESNLYTNAHKVTVKEVVQATSYTYLNVEENNESFWIAVNRSEYTEGVVLYYDEGLEMNNFESKDLQRTFETVYFVQGISDQPKLPGSEKQPSMAQTQPQKPTLEKLDVSIEPAEGGISIGTLFANRETYKDQIVKIRGQVTKFNPNIMGKNWIHLRDGTGGKDTNDLTITTSAIATLGDIVVVSGVVVANKDFGYGYKYDIIIEDAIVTVE
ncbi:MAG: SH3-like domain-containing protein [Cyclobacteriaceae bacterium]|nr:SH3-like domain-containing protein [Cyclobacteriaceae bacterium]